MADRELHLLHYVVAQLSGNTMIASPGAWVYVLRPGARPAETKSINNASGDKTLLVDDVGGIKAGDVVQLNASDDVKGTVGSVSRTANTITFSSISGGTFSFDSTVETDRLVLDPTVAGSRLAVYTSDSGTSQRADYAADGYLTADSDGVVWGFLARPDYDLYITGGSLTPKVVWDVGRATVAAFVRLVDFDVRGNNTDETSKVQEAIDYAVAKNLKLLWGGLTVRCDSTLTVGGDLAIEGVTDTNSVLDSRSAGDALTVTAGALNISDMKITGTNGIDFSGGASWSSMERCTIEATANGIVMGPYQRMIGVSVVGNGAGVGLATGGNNAYIERPRIENFSTGLSIADDGVDVISGHVIGCAANGILVSGAFTALMDVTSTGHTGRSLYTDGFAVNSRVVCGLYDDIEENSPGTIAMIGVSFT